MKRFFALLTLAALCLSLLSCTAKNDGLYYKSIIRDVDSGMDLSDGIKAISSESGKMMIIYGEGTAKGEGEIVFGDTRRGVSTDAKKILSDKMRDSHETCGYLIYKAADGSVGVVWTDVYGMSAAMACFAENYADLRALHALPSGVICFSDFTPEGYYS